MSETVMVTGCSSGLGRALCQQLAVRSFKGIRVYNTFATSRRKEALLDLRGEHIEIEELDVTCESSISACVKRVESLAGNIDVLICNAGIAATAPLAEQKMEDIDHIFQTNTLGVLRCIQAVVPAMMRRRSGKIVVVGSITAALASPFNGAYAASKAALHSMCDTLEMELKPFGVSLTEVWAGTMKTDINAKVADKLQCSGSAYQPIAKEIRERAELLEKGDVMPPEQVADAIVKGLEQKRTPRFVSSGSDVRLYSILGFMQYWLCPAKISDMFQEKFGLKTLEKYLQIQAKTGHKHDVLVNAS